MGIPLPPNDYPIQPLNYLQSRYYWDINNTSNSFLSYPVTIRENISIYLRVSGISSTYPPFRPHCAIRGNTSSTDHIDIYLNYDEGKPKFVINGSTIYTFPILPIYDRNNIIIELECYIKEDLGSNTYRCDITYRFQAPYASPGGPYDESYTVTDYTVDFGTDTQLKMYNYITSPFSDGYELFLLGPEEAISEMPELVDFPLFMGSIYLGEDIDNLAELSRFGRNFSEKNIEHSKSERTASGRLVRDIITTKKEFTLSYNLIDGADLDTFENFYLIEDELSLRVYYGPEWYDYTDYTVFVQPIDYERVLMFDDQLWGNVDIVLEEV